MQKLIHIFFIIICSACSSSSNDNYPEGRQIIPKTGTLIYSYLSIPKRITTQNNILETDRNMNLLVSGDTETYGSSFKFNEISSYYKDTHYKGDYLSQAIMSEPIRAIHVYSLSDYNKDYKKNQIIDDLINIKYQSYYDFIQSNYQKSINTNFELALSKFNTNEVKLFSNCFSINFILAPDYEGKYSFLIKLEMSNETVESIIKDVIFKK